MVGSSNVGRGYRWRTCCDRSSTVYDFSPGFALNISRMLCRTAVAAFLAYARTVSSSQNWNDAADGRYCSGEVLSLRRIILLLVRLPRASETSSFSNARISSRRGVARSEERRGGEE